jgi:hypothetical protein
MLFDFSSDLPVTGAAVRANASSSSGGERERERSGALQGVGGERRFPGSKVSRPQRHSIGGTPSLPSSSSSSNSGARRSSGEMRCDDMIPSSLGYSIVFSIFLLVFSSY